MPLCKGCGKRILWGYDPAGRRIPLDPTAPVYELVRKDGEFDSAVVLIPLKGVGDARIRPFMVSHFATCPKADRF